jgi:hypothetical protein
MRRTLLLGIALVAATQSGCLLVAGVAGAFGVVYNMADKGLKYRYDMPVESVREKLDPFLADEQIDVQITADEEGSVVRRGRMPDGRRLRIELMPWDEATTIVFINVGIVGDTYAAEQLHTRFSGKFR